MALTDRNFYSMLPEDGGSYYGPTVFFTGDYGGGGSSLFEQPTFSYPTIVNPQPTFDYGDLTGDLQVRGPGVMNIGQYVLPNIPGIDLRDEIGEDLSGPGYTTPAAVDTTTGETVFVETGAPITNYVVDSYVPGTGGETDLGGTTDYVYTPTIDTSTPINFVTPQRISEVQDLYRSLLGREAEPGAAEWWASTGVPINEISSAIYNSPEGLAYQQAQTIQYTGPSTIDTSQGTNVAGVTGTGVSDVTGIDVTKVPELGLAGRDNENTGTSYYSDDGNYLYTPIVSSEVDSQGNPITYYSIRDLQNDTTTYGMYIGDNKSWSVSSTRPDINEYEVKFGGQTFNRYSPQVDTTGTNIDTSTARIEIVANSVPSGNLVQNSSNTFTLDLGTEFINKDYTPNIADNIANVVANTIIATDPTVNTDTAQQVANNLSQQLQDSNVSSNNNTIVINTDNSQVSGPVSPSDIPNESANLGPTVITSEQIANAESNLANIASNVANVSIEVPTFVVDTSQLVDSNVTNIANLPIVDSNIANTVDTNLSANTSLFDTTANLPVVTTDTQGNNTIVVDTSGVNANANNIIDSNIANVDSNIPGTSNVIVDNIGDQANANVITLDTNGNANANISANVPGTANIITIDTGDIANANANVLPIVPNANIITLDTGNANANANITAIVPNANANLITFDTNANANLITFDSNANANANLITFDSNANANANANVIVGNVLQNVITSTNIANVDGNVANIGNIANVVTIPNVVTNVANVVTSTPYVYSNLIGNMTLANGSQYLQPGLVAPTPFYQTTSPVQSQYSWGSRMLQPGPTFNEQFYNTMPSASATPWGIQNIRTTSLTPQELADIFAGKSFKPVEPSVATPTNINYRTVPQQLQAIQPTGPGYTLLPTLPIRPIANNLSNIANTNPNSYVSSSQAYDDYMAQIQQGGI